MNNELNRAMIKVISTQFKKDAKEAHELVESYGYRIYKADGVFKIRNDETNKYICMSRRYRFEYNTGSKRINSLSDLEVVDLVGILEKPINYEYHSLMWGNTDPIHSKYENMRSRLSSAKWNVKYHTSRVNEIQQKMTELQNQLIAESKRLAEYQLRLKDVKKGIKEEVKGVA